MNTITTERANEVLEHYGVKGMRWGVRKKRSRSSESKDVSTLRKKKAFELSNDELKRVNARLNLEKQYSQLNPSTATRAKKAVGGVLSSIGKSSVSNTLSDMGTKYAKELLSKG